MDPRRRPRPSALLLLLSLGSVLAHGATDTPTQLDDFLVRERRLDALSTRLPHGDLSPPAPNFGPELLAIPGVYAQVRAADAGEPNIRGLGFDRVTTTYNGLPLVNGSPERTNAPVAIVGASAVTEIVVTKALPSVTLGPITTGGQVALTSSRPAGESTRGHLTTTYRSDRCGTTMTGDVTAVRGPWEAGATFFGNELGDYSDGHGHIVAGRFSDHGGSASLGWRGPMQHTRVEVLHRRLRREETVALPLDGKNTDADVVSFNQEWAGAPESPLEGITVRAGYAMTDPYITSEDRPSPPIRAQATARSGGGGVSTTWRVAPTEILVIGADVSHQARRAVRTTPTGRDNIWPGVHSTDAGVFAEWTRTVAAKKFRLGARFDDVRSDAADADAPALGQSLRTQYVAYNGPDAAVTRRHDRVAAVNAVVTWTAVPATTGYFGAGYSAQPAPATERYRAFLNALGGDGHGGNAVELGNPALPAERKTTLEAGLVVRRPTVELEITAYGYRIDDFIVRQPIGVTRPPLTTMTVFGYRSTDALLWGAEAAVRLNPTVGWTVPLSIAASAGRNRGTGFGLAEIPPLELRAAVRRSGVLYRRAAAIEWGVRCVGAKENPAPLENPLFTHAGGFALWHVRSGIALWSHTRFEVGIENLLNHAYTEYLTPPTAPVRPASGTLRPGDRVPGPGRSVWASVALQW